MLLQFIFKNYKSFVEEAALDMTATNNKDRMDTLIHIHGCKVLPIAGIFGANGSGKSNFFDAFHAMCTEVIGSSHSIEPFMFDTNLKQTATEFEVSIYVEGKKYSYGFLKNRKEVFEEWLYEQKTLSKKKCIFYRKKDSLFSEFTSKKEKAEIESVFSTLPKSKLLLTALGEKESVYSKIYIWFKRTTTYQCHSNLMKDSLALQMLETLPKVKDDVLKLLQEFDSSIVDLEVIKQSNGSYKIYSYHLNEKCDKIKIPFKKESQGMQKILSLATYHNPLV